MQIIFSIFLLQDVWWQLRRLEAEQKWYLYIYRTGRYSELIYPFQEIGLKISEEHRMTGEEHYITGELSIPRIVYLFYHNSDGPSWGFIGMRDLCSGFARALRDPKNMTRIAVGQKGSGAVDALPDDRIGPSLFPVQVLMAAEWQMGSWTPVSSFSWSVSRGTYSWPVHPQ